MALHVWAAADAAAAKAGGPARPDATGYAAGLLGSLIAGSVFVAVKGIGAEMPPWTLVCMRSLISAAILMPLVASHHREMTAFVRSRCLSPPIVMTWLWWSTRFKLAVATTASRNDPPRSDTERLLVTGMAS